MYRGVSRLRSFVLRLKGQIYHTRNIQQLPRYENRTVDNDPLIHSRHAPSCIRRLARARPIDLIWSAARHRCHELRYRYEFINCTVLYSSVSKYVTLSFQIERAMSYRYSILASAYGKTHAPVSFYSMVCFSQTSLKSYFRFCEEIKCEFHDFRSFYHFLVLLVL